MTDKEIMGLLIEATVENRNLEPVGKELFRLATESGVPIEMGLNLVIDRMKLDKKQGLYVLSVYQDSMMQHKLEAGGKRKKQYQSKNMSQLKKYWKIGELI